MGGGRGKWEGKRTCPICKKSISKRGYAWRKHEATHPELVKQREEAAAVFRRACRIAGIK
jgi:hypothetical protein